MAEESFPVVEQPMSADKWQSVTLGIGNGILDEGGFPYKLKGLNNSTNTGVLQAASRQDGTKFSAAVLNGFYHRLDEDMTLKFPAVTSATTYRVVLEYDPARSDMPVKVKVVASLDSSGGKNYLHLHDVERKPNQLLTDAVVTMRRPRVAPVQVYASESDMPDAQHVLWGTIALIHNGRSHGTGVLKMAITGDDAESTNGWFWKTIYDPADTAFAWEDKDDSSSYTSPVASGYKRAIGRRGQKRALRGRVSLATGDPFRANLPYRIFSGGVPAGDAPARTVSALTGISGVEAGVGFARTEVLADGDVVAYPSRSCSWIALDGLEWEVA